CQFFVRAAFRLAQGRTQSRCVWIYDPSERGILSFFTRLRACELLSLGGQEQVVKETATPRSRPTHSPCATCPRGRSGVRRQSVHGLTSNWPTSCGPPCGLILRNLAAIEGAR